MSSQEKAPFVPILTVMPDYGGAPFLWIVRNPEEKGVGANLCCATVCDDDYYPLSPGLWQKFADWAMEFCREPFYLDQVAAEKWHWEHYHQRGLQLSRWLKEEVGDAYRVIYKKPYEDPGADIDERREVMANGTLVTLEPLRKRPL